MLLQCLTAVAAAVDASTPASPATCALPFLSTIILLAATLGCTRPVSAGAASTRCFTSSCLRPRHKARVLISRNPVMAAAAAGLSFPATAPRRCAIGRNKNSSPQTPLLRRYRRQRAFTRRLLLERPYRRSPVGGLERHRRGRDDLRRWRSSGRVGGGFRRALCPPRVVQGGWSLQLVGLRSSSCCVRRRRKPGSAGSVVFDAVEAEAAENYPDYEKNGDIGDC